MQVLVLGADGYLGWTVSRWLAARGYEVTGLDSYKKRVWMANTGVVPLFGNEMAHKRAEAAGFTYVHADAAATYALTEYDAVIHFAEQPSAPYSMISPATAWETIENNLKTTHALITNALNDHPTIHVLKLGSMGVWGQPPIPIPSDGMLPAGDSSVRFPYKPGSVYHVSKCQDSEYLSFVCRNSGTLRVTDLHQGVVYGVPDDCIAGEYPRFYYDHIFGTALNRFLVQGAVQYPLTVYGTGEHQRTFINIMDTCRCIEIALDNPPAEGEYKSLNQFTEVFSINDLAEMVRHVTGAEINHITNPRVELEKHFYEPSNAMFLALGLEPRKLDFDELVRLLALVGEHTDNIEEGCIAPTIRWRRS